MPQLPSFNPPRSQPMPIPSSNASHARNSRYAFREGSDTSESARSASSRGSSDLIFPMDLSTTPERRSHYQSYAGGHAAAYLPQTDVVPPPFPTIRARCSGCGRDFVPQSDTAARIRMCDYCRDPPRLPAQYAAQMYRGGQSRRDDVQRYQSQAAAPPVPSSTRQHIRYNGIHPSGSAPTAQPVVRGPPLRSLLYFYG
ncbi:uncharacterized protein B0H18DRAFT_133207 [Fomitopsis serialis]|uniref:uncharacterized protein n=1 Tax=Fomitopsis serialis TaxID=139415 RepID=UPI0020088273|nr:uncharacterized protein B0H18DRAFT_133207 [Neoantrodia serialis]KAH9930716.1 hypothetical protein B0H18DRAFT_133207 [Neoantrodia serialis]